MTDFRYSGTDGICALFITLLVLLLGAATLTCGLPYWGDDSAAYISEGIAIADGTFRKQAELNYIMHPADLSDEADPEGLVYVWGYPLMLAGVYKAVGFDRMTYSSVLWYKLPLLLSLSLTGGALFLFYRRRFSAGLSAVLAIILCFSTNIVKHLNYLYADIPFLFFSVLTLLSTELYSARASRSRSMTKREKAGTAIAACLYGAVMWYTHELRLNGMTVCIIAALGHGLFLWKMRNRIRGKDLWLHCLPYVVMAALLLVSEHVFLAPATPNISDVGKAGPDVLRSNIETYWNMIFNYLNRLSKLKIPYTGYVFIAACVLGILRNGFAGNLHLLLLLAGTLAVDLMLPYTQGLRYIYNILPLLLMFTAYGLQAVGKLFRRILPLPGKLTMCIKICAAALVLYLPLHDAAVTGLQNLRNWGVVKADDVYAEDAVEMYRYIREHVPEDGTIAFGKPRSLYLNTERVCIRTGYNGHKISDAGYYLEYHTNNPQFTVEKEEAEATPKEKLYGNDTFTLYQVKHE